MSSRRQFLLAGAVGVGGIAGAGCSEPRSARSGQPTTTDRATVDRAAAARSRVIVLGAGLAGLVAATDLRARGWDVTVLEARERVGGRVLTIREPFTGGQVAEAGPEFIDDSHARLLARVAALGLRTQRRPAAGSRDDTVSFRGQVRTESELPSSVARGFLLWQNALDEIADGIDPEAPDTAARAEELDSRSAASLLDSLGLDDLARFVIAGVTGSEYACDLEQLSLLFLAQQEVLPTGGESEAMRVEGGNDQVPKLLAQALGGAIVTGAPVTQVKWTADTVEVSSGAMTVHGRHLVVAIPPPALRNIAFSPALPTAVASWVHDMELGAATKTITQYSERFWRRAGPSGWGESLADLDYRVSWDATDTTDTPGGILTAFTTAQYGEALGRLDDATRIARVQQQVEGVLGGAPRLRGATFTRVWQQEKFTGGGYAHFRPGQMVPWWKPLRDPVGPIRFAGEHTEALAGYMESAVRSGERIAVAIGVAPHR